MIIENHFLTKSGVIKYVTQNYLLHCYNYERIFDFMTKLGEVFDLKNDCDKYSFLITLKKNGENSVELSYEPISLLAKNGNDLLLFVDINIENGVYGKIRSLTGKRFRDYIPNLNIKI